MLFQNDDGWSYSAVLYTRPIVLMLDIYAKIFMGMFE